MPHNTFNTLDSLDLGDGRRGQFYSLPKLEAAGVGNVSKLPVSIRIVLESVLRNVDGKKIAENDVRTLANWQASAERTDEIPFMVARVLLQDFTGVPLLVDLAAMPSRWCRSISSSITPCRSTTPIAPTPCSSTWTSSSSAISSATSF